MKLRVYLLESGSINGKIVLDNNEVRHLFGRVPSRNARSMSHMFRTSQWLHNGHLMIRQVNVDESESRLEYPWLRTYGKVAWFLTPKQEVSSNLSLDSYGKNQGTVRETFVELEDVQQGEDHAGAFLMVPVRTKAMDLQPQPAEPTLQERAYDAVRLINSFADDNEGRVALTLHNGRLQLWSTPLVT